MIDLRIFLFLLELSLRYGIAACVTLSVVTAGLVSTYLIFPNAIERIEGFGYGWFVTLAAGLIIFEAIHQRALRSRDVDNVAAGTTRVRWFWIIFCITTVLVAVAPSFQKILPLLILFFAVAVFILAVLLALPQGKRAKSCAEIATQGSHKP